MNCWILSLTQISYQNGGYTHIRYFRQTNM